ncbi:hypothetical protein BC832DRAFT_536547 [Gaertneriomyces semiglobifer]|nr:hypothetical protein BC832DRAFT_536547 [Gaertneriomyces semiglobifer]
MRDKPGHCTNTAWNHRKDHWRIELWCHFQLRHVHRLSNFLKTGRQRAENVQFPQMLIQRLLNNKDMLKVWIVSLNAPTIFQPEPSEFRRFSAALLWSGRRSKICYEQVLRTESREMVEIKLEEDHDHDHDPSEISTTATATHSTDADTPVRIKSEPPPLDLIITVPSLPASSIPSNAGTRLGFTRAFISHCLGGSAQDTLPRIHLHRKQVVDTRTYYGALRPEWNPHCPRVPGAHGAANLVRMSEMVGSRALEWSLLPESTRTTWIRGILSSEWGYGFVRRAGYDWRALAIPKGRQAAWLDGLLTEGKVTLQQVIMQCIGYNEELYSKMREEEQVVSERLVPEEEVRVKRERNARRQVKGREKRRVAREQRLSAAANVAAGGDQNASAGAEVEIVDSDDVKAEGVTSDDETSDYEEETTDDESTPYNAPKRARLGPGGDVARGGSATPQVVKIERESHPDMMCASDCSCSTSTSDWSYADEVEPATANLTVKAEPESDTSSSTSSGPVLPPESTLASILAQLGSSSPAPETSKLRRSLRRVA